MQFPLCGNTESKRKPIHRPCDYCCFYINKSVFLFQRCAQPPLCDPDLITVCIGKRRNRHDSYQTSRRLVTWSPVTPYGISTLGHYQELFHKSHTAAGVLPPYIASTQALAKTIPAFRNSSFHVPANTTWTPFCFSLLLCYWLLYYIWTSPLTSSQLWSIA